MRIYNMCKQEPNATYDEIRATTEITSHCDWYEFGKKYNKW